MNIVFMGTPDFAVPTLDLLAETNEVSLVVTRPDAVRGRGKTKNPSPVKARALELGLPVLEAKKITTDELERIRALRPDLIVVAAYGCILPDELLNLAPQGCVNVHASLLPAWRGAAPIQRAILAGDKNIGVSIMKVVHDLDAGPYCIQGAIPRGDKSAEELIRDLAELGAGLLVESFDLAAAGNLVWREQDSSHATYAPKIKKDEMKLSPEASAQHFCLSTQASSDTAPLRISLGGKPVRILKARISDESLKPGEVLAHHKKLYLGCADKSVEIVSLKPDGKRVMDSASYVAGMREADAQWSRVS